MNAAFEKSSFAIKKSWQSKIQHRCHKGCVEGVSGGEFKLHSLGVRFNTKFFWMSKCSLNVDIKKKVLATQTRSVNDVDESFLLTSHIFGSIFAVH